MRILIDLFYFNQPKSFCFNKNSIYITQKQQPSNINKSYLLQIYAVIATAMPSLLFLRFQSQEKNDDKNININQQNCIPLSSNHKWDMYLFQITITSFQIQQCHPVFTQKRKKKTDTETSHKKLKRNYVNRNNNNFCGGRCIIFHGR